MPASRNGIGSGVREGIAITRSVIQRRALRVGLFASVAVLFAPAAAHAAPPQACFTVNPSSPLTNEPTTLDSSCSTDDNRIDGRGWDLDNDGHFDDSFSTKVTKTWSQPGTYTVRLGVIDPADNYDIETKTITVRNRLPIADFSIARTNTDAGTPVTFTSSSHDDDGTIVSQRWALDPDGKYDDGSGKSASRTYSTPGTYNVKLEVTDNRGGTKEISKPV